MTSILNEAKIHFQKKDFLSPSHEWDYLEALFKKQESDRLPLLHWVFEESSAYWDTRARAGMILLEEGEVATWEALRKLVTSSDPDDNGTALSVFQRTNDPRGLEFAQAWLNDGVHSATQLEAINFLKDADPEKGWVRVQALINHDESNIRNAAKKLAEEINAS